MMAAILVVMAEDGSEVALVVPPPPVTKAGRSETGLPVSPGGGVHGSPAWSELEGSRGAMARTDIEQPPVSHGVLVADIPFDGEEDTEVKPPAILSSRSW